MLSVLWDITFSIGSTAAMGQLLVYDDRFNVKTLNEDLKHVHRVKKTT